MAVRFSLYLKESGGRPQPEANTFGANGTSLKGTNGRTVILIHGVTGTPQEMSHLARSLNKKGYSVVCPLLANHGGSLNRLKNSKWQDFYQSVRNAFSEIASSKPGPIFVSGLSIGALLALLLADEFKEQVSGVTCLSPTLFYDGWNIPWSKRFLFLAYFTPLKYFFYFKEEPPYGIKNKAIREVVHRYYSNATFDDTDDAIKYGYPYIPMTLLCQHYLLVKYFIKRLPSINVPTQLIQAREDDMTSARNSQFIYDRIGSRIKEMVMLDDSYHVITVDQERDKVASDIERFYASIAANHTKPTA